VLALKTKVLGEMGESGHDNAKLRDLTDWLRRELDLEARYKGVLTEAEKLVAERRNPVSEDAAGQVCSESTERGGRSAAGEFQQVAGKTGASDFRDAYLAREKGRGKHLTKVGRIYFRNDEGAVLGVTFSSEDRGKRESTWFLNLKDGEFQEAALLCQTAAGCAQVVHLPRSFIDRFGQQFSRDGKGEVKFNLARRGGRFWLQVPGPTGWVDVGEYTDGELVVPRRPEYA
jgi:hypothetical protein